MIGRKSLLIVISTILSSSLAFVGLYAMTNFLGRDVYGNLVWVLATLGTLNVVADLGFGSAHIKRLSEGQDEGDCISTYVSIKLVLTAVMAVFVLSSLLVWSGPLGGNISPDAWNLVILFVLYYAMYDISAIATNTFVARMETTKSQLVAFVDPLIRIPLIVFISLNHLTSTDLAFAYVFAAMGVLVSGMYVMTRGRFRWKRPTLFRSYLKFALPISLIAIAGSVTLNLDKILIGYFDTPGNVAYYSSAQTLLATLGVIGTAVATLTFPSFSKMHSEGNIEGIRQATHQAERYIAMIGIPVVTLIIVFPNQISVALFGPQFAAAGDTMRYLAIAMALTLLNQIYTSQILGVNRPDITAKITLGTFMLNVALLFIFIPDSLFGIRMLGLSYIGAALATALTAVAVFISIRLIVRSLTRTKSNPRILRHVLAGFMTGAVIFALNSVFPLSGLIRLIIYGGVTLILFFISLTVLREFHRSDIRYFLDIVNPSKMFSYMGQEMKNKK
jgi:O-antigen/teichoic acid export membrane protein